MPSRNESKLEEGKSSDMNYNKTLATPTAIDRGDIKITSKSKQNKKTSKVQTKFCALKQK